MIFSCYCGVFYLKRQLEELIFQSYFPEIRFKLSKFMQRCKRAKKETGGIHLYTIDTQSYQNYDNRIYMSSFYLLLLSRLQRWLSQVRCRKKARLCQACPQQQVLIQLEISLKKVSVYQRFVTLMKTHHQGEVRSGLAVECYNKLHQSSLTFDTNPCGDDADFTMMNIISIRTTVGA